MRAFVRCGLLALALFAWAEDAAPQAIITIASPTNGAVFTAPATIAISAAPAGLARQQSYANSTPINIVDVSPAIPSPSTISVRALSGLISQVIVTVNSFGHQYSSDVGMLLVGPNGSNTVLMNNAGSGYAVSGLNLTFAQSAATPVPISQPLTSGTFLPSDYQPSYNFETNGLNNSPDYTATNPPPPPGPYATNLNVFNGLNANTNWYLYAQDDSAGDVGFITKGWSLQILTQGSTNVVATNVQFLVNGSVIGNSTSSPYSASASSLAAGSYTVSAVAMYSDGSNETNAVEVTVAAPPQPPAIISQPSGQTVTADGNTSFSVRAAGTAPLTYQWQFNSANLTNGNGVSGSTSNTLTLAGVSPSDAGTYQVIVSNAVGSVTSSPAVLVVSAGQPPSITSQPLSLTVAAGGFPVFSVAATGTAPLDYQWQFNGGPISGATASTLKLNNAQAPNGGSYSVVITNAFGSVASATATLTVNSPPTVSITSPTNGTILTVPATIIISAVASGSGGQQSYTNASPINIVDVSPSIPSPSTISASGLGGVISQVIVTVSSFSHEFPSDVGMLLVGPNGSNTVLMNNAGSRYPASGLNLTFSESAAMPLPLSQPLTNGAFLPSDYQSVKPYSFETNGLNNPSPPDPLPPPGPYPTNLDVFNGLNPNTNWKLYVQDDVAGDVGFITNGWTLQILTVGASNATVTNVEFLVNGSVISNSTAPPYTAIAANLAIGTYTLSAVATDSNGMKATNAVTVTVSAPQPPAITSQPSGQAAMEGSNATLSVAATGTAPLTYQWQFNSTNLTNGNGVSGSTSNTLTLSGVAQSEAGTYQVIVSNAVGSVTSSPAVLVVTYSPGANHFATLYDFTGGADGGDPDGGLVLSGSMLYGTASSDGASGNGTVFALNANGTDFTILHSFTAASPSAPHANNDGAAPQGTLVLSGSTLFGTDALGGSSGNGTVFAVATNGIGFAVLHNFTGGNDGGIPQGALVLSAGTLYGTAFTGGSSGEGTVFALNTNGTGFTVLHSFTTLPPYPDPSINNDGANPAGGLILSGTTLYGAATYGGSLAFGTVFALNTNGTGFAVLHSFTGGNDGGYPSGGLLLSANTLYGTANYGGSFIYGTVFALKTNGTSLTTLHSFSGGSDGGYPNGYLILSGTSLYGTARSFGGSGTSASEGSGAVFALNTNGTDFTVLYDFTPISLSSPTTNGDGANSTGGVILSGAILYGMAAIGGSLDNGTVFALPAGSTMEAPSVTSQPSSQTVTAGDDATISVTASGTTPLTFQWQFDSANLTDGNGISGSTSDTLTVSGAHVFQAGPYQVIVSNAFGSVTSSPAALTVNQVGLEVYVPGGTRPYGEATPGSILQGSVENQVNDDILVGVSCNASPSAPPGAYPLAVVFQDTSDPQAAGDYYIDFGNSSIGMVVVTPPDVSAFTTPPTNDNFSGRIALLGANPVATGNNFGATMEPGEPDPSGGITGVTHSAWWSWVAPASGFVRINANGSSFETFINVYTGNTVSGLAPVANNLEAIVEDPQTGESGISNQVSFTAAAGTTYQIAINGFQEGTISFVIQPVTVQAQNLQEDVNDTNGALFSATLQIGNAGVAPVGPLQVQLVARAGVSWQAAFDNPPDPTQFPGDAILGVFPLASPASLAPGTTASLSISGICPAPSPPGSDPAYGWGVFMLLEEQLGTSWVPVDQDLLFYGVWPSVGPFSGPGGGVIRLDPSYSTSPPSIFATSIDASPVIEAVSNAAYHGTVTFNNGTTVQFTNTEWQVSSPSVTISSNGVLQTGAIVTNSLIALTGYYAFNGETNGITTNVLVLYYPSNSITAVSLLPKGRMQFTLNTLPHAAFAIDGTTNLSKTNSWTPLATNRDTGPSGIWFTNDLNFTNFTNFTDRFYRARRLTN